MQGEYRAVIALNWLATKSCIQMTKIADLIMSKLFAKNTTNHATFVKGFWPEFYASGRFMKYSMSGGITFNVQSFSSSKWLHLGIQEG